MGDDCLFFFFFVSSDLSAFNAPHGKITEWGQNREISNNLSWNLIRFLDCFLYSFIYLFIFCWKFFLLNLQTSFSSYRPPFLFQFAMESCKTIHVSVSYSSYPSVYVTRVLLLFYALRWCVLTDGNCLTSLSPCTPISYIPFSFDHGETALVCYGAKSEYYHPHLGIIQLSSKSPP